MFAAMLRTVIDGYRLLAPMLRTVIDGYRVFSAMLRTVIDRYPSDPSAMLREHRRPSNIVKLDIL